MKMPLTQYENLQTVLIRSYDVPSTDVKQD